MARRRLADMPSGSGSKPELRLDVDNSSRDCTSNTGASAWVSLRRADKGMWFWMWFSGGGALWLRRGRVLGRVGVVEDAH